MTRSWLRLFQILCLLQLSCRQAPGDDGGDLCSGSHVGEWTRAVENNDEDNLRLGGDCFFVWLSFDDCIYTGIYEISPENQDWLQMEITEASAHCMEIDRMVCEHSGDDLTLLVGEAEVPLYYSR